MGNFGLLAKVKEGGAWFSSRIPRRDGHPDLGRAILLVARAALLACGVAPAMVCLVFWGLVLMPLNFLRSQLGWLGSESPAPAPRGTLEMFLASWGDLIALVGSTARRTDWSGLAAFAESVGILGVALVSAVLGVLVVAAICIGVILATSGLRLQRFVWALPVFVLPWLYFSAVHRMVFPAFVTEIVSATPIEIKGYEYVLMFYTVLTIWMSCLMYVLLGLDKFYAQREFWRTPEKTLHLFEFWGGWPGSFAAQRLYWHKVRKAPYQSRYWRVVAGHVLVAAGVWGCLWFSPPSIAGEREEDFPAGVVRLSLSGMALLDGKLVVKLEEGVEVWNAWLEDRRGSHANLPDQTTTGRTSWRWAAMEGLAEWGVVIADAALKYLLLRWALCLVALSAVRISDILLGRALQRLSPSHIVVKFFLRGAILMGISVWLPGILASIGWIILGVLLAFERGAFKVRAGEA